MLALMYRVRKEFRQPDRESTGFRRGRGGRRGRRRLGCRQLENNLHLLHGEAVSSPLCF